MNVVILVLTSVGFDTYSCFLWSGNASSREEKVFWSVVRGQEAHFDKFAQGNVSNKESPKNDDLTERCSEQVFVILVHIRHTAKQKCADTLFDE